MGRDFIREGSEDLDQDPQVAPQQPQPRPKLPQWYGNRDFISEGTDEQPIDFIELGRQAEEEAAKQPRKKGWDERWGEHVPAWWRGERGFIAGQPMTEETSPKFKVPRPLQYLLRPTDPKVWTGEAADEDWVLSPEVRGLLNAAREGGELIADMGIRQPGRAIEGVGRGVLGSAAATWADISGSKGAREFAQEQFYEGRKALEDPAEMVVGIPAEAVRAKVQVADMIGWAGEELGIPEDTAGQNLHNFLKENGWDYGTFVEEFEHAPLGKLLMVFMGIHGKSVRGGGPGGPPGLSGRLFDPTSVIAQEGYQPGSKYLPKKEPIRLPISKAQREGKLMPRLKKPGELSLRESAEWKPLFRRDAELDRVAKGWEKGREREFRAEFEKELGERLPDMRGAAEGRRQTRPVEGADAAPPRQGNDAAFLADKLDEGAQITLERADPNVVGSADRIVWRTPDGKHGAFTLDGGIDGLPEGLVRRVSERQKALKEAGIDLAEETAAIKTAESRLEALDPEKTPDYEKRRAELEDQIKVAKERTKSGERVIREGGYRRAKRAPGAATTLRNQVYDAAREEMRRRDEKAAIQPEDVAAREKQPGSEMDAIIQDDPYLRARWKAAEELEDGKLKPEQVKERIAELELQFNEEMRPKVDPDKDLGRITVEEEIEPPEATAGPKPPEKPKSALETSPPPIPEPPEGSTARALWDALHRDEGAAESWAMRRMTGMSDADLIETVRNIWRGEHGTGSVDRGYRVTAGLDRLKFWNDFYGPNEGRTPTLSGKKLLREIRRMTGVGVKPAKQTKKAPPKLKPKGEPQPQVKWQHKLRDTYRHFTMKGAGDAIRGKGYEKADRESPYRRGPQGNFDKPPEDFYPPGTIFLSLDDPFWNKTSRATGKGEWVESTPANEAKYKALIDSGEAEFRYNYEKQQYEIGVGTSETVQLEGVNAKIKPDAMVYTVDSFETLDRLRALVGQERVDWTKPETWKRISVVFDVVEIRNAKKLGTRESFAPKGVPRDWRFFEQMTADQVIVLNKGALDWVKPKEKAPAKTQYSVGQKVRVKNANNRWETAYVQETNFDAKGREWYVVSRTPGGKKGRREVVPKDMKQAMIRTGKKPEIPKAPRPESARQDPRGLMRWIASEGGFRNDRKTTTTQDFIKNNWSKGDDNIPKLYNSKRGKTIEGWAEHLSERGGWADEFKSRTEAMEWLEEQLSGGEIKVEREIPADVPPDMYYGLMPQGGLLAEWGIAGSAREGTLMLNKLLMDPKTTGKKVKPVEGDVLLIEDPSSITGDVRWKEGRQSDTPDVFRVKRDLKKNQLVLTDGGVIRIPLDGEGRMILPDFDRPQAMLEAHRVGKIKRKNVRVTGGGMSPGRKPITLKKAPGVWKRGWPEHTKKGTLVEVRNVEKFREDGINYPESAGRVVRSWETDHGQVGVWVKFPEMDAPIKLLAEDISPASKGKLGKKWNELEAAATEAEANIYFMDGKKNAEKVRDLADEARYMIDQHRKGKDFTDAEIQKQIDSLKENTGTRPSMKEAAESVEEAKLDREATEKADATIEAGRKEAEDTGQGSLIDAEATARAKAEAEAKKREAEAKEKQDSMFGPEDEFGGEQGRYYTVVKRIPGQRGKFKPIGVDLMTKKEAMDYFKSEGLSNSTHSILDMRKEAKKGKPKGPSGGGNLFSPAEEPTVQGAEVLGATPESSARPAPDVIPDQIPRGAKPKSDTANVLPSVRRSGEGVKVKYGAGFIDWFKRKYNKRLRSRRKIAEDIDKATYTTRRAGRLVTRTAAGYFEVLPRIVRLRADWGHNLGTIAHEAGHSIQRLLMPEHPQPGMDVRNIEPFKAQWDEIKDLKNDLAQMKKARGGRAPDKAYIQQRKPIVDRINTLKIAMEQSVKANKELAKLGKMLYGDKRPYGGYGSEGFAEFLRLWMEDRPHAKKLAPNFYAIFLDRLYTDPATIKAGRLMDQVARDWQRLRKTPQLARLMTKIESRGRRQRPLKLSRLYQAVMDEYHPMHQVVRQIYGGDPEHGVGNPYTHMRLWRGWRGAAEAYVYMGQHSMVIDPFIRKMNVLELLDKPDVLEGRKSVWPAPAKHGKLDSDTNAIARSMLGFVKERVLKIENDQFWVTEKGKERLKKQGSLKVGPALAEILRPVASKLDEVTAAALDGPSPLKKLIEKSFGEGFLDEQFKDLREFDAYLYAKHADALRTRGIESGLTPQEIAAGLELESRPGYLKAHEQLMKYQENLLWELVEEGIYTEKDFRLMREANPYYVPLKRIFEESTPGKRGTRGENILGQGKPFRRLKGSDMQIQSPLQSIIENTFIIVNRIKANQVVRMLHEYAMDNPGSGWVINQVKKKKLPTGFRLSEISKDVIRGMERAGVPEEFFAEMSKSDIRAALDAIQSQVWRYEKRAPNGIAAYWRRGKQTFLEVDKDLYNMLSGMDRDTAHVMIRMFGAPARLLRAGATLNPQFMVKNLIRDAASAGVFARYGFTPGIDSLKGMKSRITHDDHYYRWLVTGGSQATMIAMDRNYLKTSAHRLAQSQTFFDRMKRRGLTATMTPMETLRTLSEVAEEGTRVGVYRRATDKLGLDQNSLLRAAVESRDATLDFQRYGYVMREYNRINAFLNAQFQGVDKLGRTVMRAFKSKEEGNRFVFALGKYIMAPSLLTWWLNRNNPEYGELDDYVRDLHWAIPTGRKDPAFLLIPKPHETAVLFGSSIERAMRDMWKLDKESMEEYWGSVMNALMPELVPTFLMPAVSNMANRRWPGRPVESLREQKLDPEMRYGPYTSETSKLLASALRKVPISLVRPMHPYKQASPVQVDNYIRSWTGGLGNIITHQVLDPIVVHGTKNLLPEYAQSVGIGKKLTGTRSFVQRYFGTFVVGQDRLGRGEVDRFYRELEAARQTYNSFSAKSSDDAMRYVEKTANLKRLLRYQALTQGENNLTTLNRMMRDAIQAKDRQKQLEVWQRIRTTVREALKMADQAEKDETALKALWMGWEERKEVQEENGRRGPIRLVIEEFAQNHDWDGMAKWLAEVPDEDKSWAWRTFKRLEKRARQTAEERQTEKTRKKLRLGVKERAEERIAK